MSGSSQRAFFSLQLVQLRFARGLLRRGVGVDVDIVVVDENSAVGVTIGRDVEEAEDLVMEFGELDVNACACAVAGDGEGEGDGEGGCWGMVEDGVVE